MSKPKMPTRKSIGDTNSEFSLYGLRVTLPGGQQFLVAAPNAKNEWHYAWMSYREALDAKKYQQRTYDKGLRRGKGRILVTIALLVDITGDGGNRGVR